MEEGNDEDTALEVAVAIDAMFDTEEVVAPLPTAFAEASPSEVGGTPKSVPLDCCWSQEGYC